VGASAAESSGEQEELSIISKNKKAGPATCLLPECMFASPKTDYRRMGKLIPA
jgi:hypothetical protein